MDSQVKLQEMRILRTIVAGLSLTAAVALPMLFATTAMAHGPCGEGCLSVRTGAPGDEVTILDSETVLVVWNPPPNTMALGVPGANKDCNTQCASEKPIYHHDEPSSVLHRSETPQPVSFEVPETQPGRYVIAIYDGSENGFHYTWDIFEVTASRPTDPVPDPEKSPRTAEKKSAVWLIPIGTFIVGGAVGWTLQRSRR